MQSILVFKIVFTAAYIYCTCRFVIMPNIFLIKMHNKFKKYGIKTVGTITKIHRSVSGSDGIIYQHLVKYTVEERVYYIDKLMNNSHPLRIGEKVEVYYDERYPSNALITNPSPNSLPFCIIFFMIFITVVLIIALFSTAPSSATTPVFASGIITTPFSVWQAG
jgi:hypothetical protein